MVKHAATMAISAACEPGTGVAGGGEKGGVGEGELIEKIVKMGLRKGSICE